MGFFLFISKSWFTLSVFLSGLSVVSIWYSPKLWPAYLNSIQISSKPISLWIGVFFCGIADFSNPRGVRIKILPWPDIVFKCSGDSSDFLALIGKLFFFFVNYQSYITSILTHLGMELEEVVPIFKPKKCTTTHPLDFKAGAKV